jgi:flavin reductase (DIM6/NTAB) family NADH-FMN oxidoreductase RutF
MFYDPRDNLRPPPLTHNPFNALVAPRPIGWISSIDSSGNVNLAPFSFFSALSSDPPLVGFALGSKDGENTPKDTLYNVREVPEFVANLASYDLREQVNLSSAVLPREVNEFEQVGLTQAPAQLVRPPLVAEARAAMECKVWKIIELPSPPGGRDRHLVIGEVIGIHIDDGMIENGRVLSSRLQQLSRLGYFEYDVVGDTFDIPRPD